MKLLTFSNGNITEQNVDITVPKWVADGSCFAAYADGDPILASSFYNGSTVSAPSPDNMGTTTARCVKFRFPKSIVGVNFRVFSIAVTSVYKFAIYNSVSTNKVWESSTISTLADDWNALPLSNLSLAAGTDYWLAMAVTGAGATVAFRTYTSPLHPNYYKAANSPLGGLSIGLPVYAQFPVSSGVFPATLPTLAAASYANTSQGSIPLAFITSY